VNAGQLSIISSLTSPITVNAGQLSVIGSVTGPVTVNAGTVSVGGSVTGPVTVNAGTVSVSGSITSPVTINAGTVSVSGSITSPVTINAGLLSIIDGTTSSVFVGPSGTMIGTGTVGTTQNLGTISPGTSIGTMTINGDFFQAIDGNLIVEIDPAGNSDLLDISGTATLAGTVTLNPQPGMYFAGSTFTFLTAASINNTFDTLSETHPLDFFINYTSNAAQIVIAFSGAVLPVPIESLKGNARAVADYLFCPDFLPSNPDLLNVMQLLLTLPADEFLSELTQLSPAQFGALPLVNLQNQTLVADTIVESSEKLFWCDRCQIDQTDKGQCLLDMTHTTLWIAPIGNFYRQDKIQDQIAFNTQTYGFTLGGSHLFFKELNFSVGAGYTHSKIHWKEQAGHGEWDSFYIGPSIGWIKNDGYVNVLLLGAYNHYNIDRQITFPGLERTANNHHNSYDLLTRVDIGYKFKVYVPGHIGYFFIFPEARLSYLNIYEESYTESRANSLNLAVDSKHTAFLEPNVLIKFLKDFYTSKYCVTPTLQVGWISSIPLSSGRYTSKFHKQKTCQPNFTVQSLHDMTNHLSLGTELVIRRLNHFLLEFGYQANFLDHSLVQHGKIKLEINF